MKNLLKNINKNSPVWLQNAVAILVLIIGAKFFLVNGLPGVDDGIKDIVGKWFDYVTSFSGLVLSISSIFSGKKTLNEKIKRP